jgi:DNA-binding NarL/FixJ family response regulator
MENSYKIFIVDDHKLFIDGLKFVLTRSGKYQISGVASNGFEFLNLLDEKNLPDLVLMDISMPTMDGIEATQKAINKYPGLKIIALTMFGDEDYYYKMVDAGVKGFVIKDSGSKELEKAIENVLEGDTYFSQELIKKIMYFIRESKNKKNGLDYTETITKKELEVLRFLCCGLSNKEIADKMNISPKTVEGHKSNLFSKTNTKNTVNLVMYSIRNRLIELK